MGPVDRLACVLNKDSRGGVILLLIPLPPRDGHQRLSLGGSSYYTELLHTPHTMNSSLYNVQSDLPVPLSSVLSQCWQFLAKATVEARFGWFHVSALHLLRRDVAHL